MSARRWSIRTRIVLAIALPAVLLLSLFSAVVYARVRADRLHDLDESLRDRAAGLAALVERDAGGRWESEPAAPLTGTLLAFEVRALDGGPVIAASPTALPAMPALPAVDMSLAADRARPRPLLLRSLVDDVAVAAAAAAAGAGRARVFAGVFLVRAEDPLGALDDDDDDVVDGDAKPAAPPADGARVSDADSDSEDHDERPLPERALERGTSEPPYVRVVVAADLAPLDEDLRSLLLTLLSMGALLATLALAAGVALSSTIVGPLARMARAAEGVTAPTAAAPLALTGSGDEIDRLASTFNATFARLYEAWERQSRFGADASHELRTPLAVVRTQAEVMLRAERTNAEYREALQHILDGSTRMQRIVEGLLLLARADRGTLAGAMTRVDVGELCHDAVAALGTPRVQVTLQAQPAPAAAWVRGNADQLGVVLANLLENATRYARTRVDVVVAHRAGAAGPGLDGTGRVVDGTGTVEISVSDDGPGIPADALPRVFDRFFRADTARARDRGDTGAGLGLSIVREIVELHGGAVRAESEPGQGATLQVSLPAAPP